MDYDKYMTDDEENMVEEDGMDMVDDNTEMTDFNRRKRIEVEEVLGIGTGETSLEVCIPLSPPAFEIRDDLILRKIEFDALVAHNGRVFVNGRVVKNIPFKTRVSTSCPKCLGLSRITFGDLKHVTVEEPFNLCIDVPGAVKGAKVVVLNASVDSVEIPNFVKVPGPDACACQPCAPVRKNRIIRSITEKECITVTVKVVKDTIISVHAREC